MCGSLPQSVSMAKIISAQRDLEIIFVEREAGVEGASSTLEDEEFSRIFIYLFIYFTFI